MINLGSTAIKNKIIKDESARKFINKWDIAIFRGGKNGILHRTPDSALKYYSSILMRLDDPSFLDEIKKVNRSDEQIYPPTSGTTN